MLSPSDPAVVDDTLNIESVFAAIQAGIMIFDLVSSRTQFSRRFVELLDLPQGRCELSMTEFARLVHPADQDAMHEKIGAAISKQQAYMHDYRVLLPSGDIKWLRSYGQPIADASGKITAIYAVALDITDIKHREHIAAESEDWRALFTWVYDPAARVYSPGRHGTSSPRTPRRVVTAEQVIGMMHPDDRKGLSDLLERLRNEDVDYYLEGRFIQQDGTYRWVVASGRLTVDPNTGRRLVRGVTQDMHKQVEARWQRAINGSHDGLFELDLRTNYLWASPRYTRMLGCADGELPHTVEYLRENTDPDDLRVMDAAFEKHLADGTPYEVEYRYRLRSGEWRWFASQASCERDEQGRPVALAGSVQDITEKKQYQHALIEATQAAAAANKTKGEFLANMSHEIRTPMNGVIGMTELLLDTQLNSIQREYVQTVRDSATSLLKVINDILDFSKVEAGKLELEQLDIDLRDTVEDVSRLLSIQATAKGLKVLIHIDPDLPALVKGDAVRIRQILLNLAGNALKFTAEGEIGIELRVLEQTSHGTRVRCEVRDTGTGIPADRLDKLFKPFSQVDSSTTRQFGGTGLGLSICKRLVDLMNGEIGVRSEPGLGSSFWFTAYFDAVDPTAVQAAPSFATLTAARNREHHRILLAEDNAVNQKVASRMLEKLGFQVDIACDGQAAVERWTSGDYDLILMDCQMPVMDGFEATRAIREMETQGRLARTVIVALTAHAMKGVDQQCVDAGMDGYLSKPIDRVQLATCLERFLDDSEPPIPAAQSQP